MKRLQGPRRHLLIYHLCLLGFALGVTLYLFLLRGLHIPFKCAFFEFFHLYCPGCGMTRAGEALLRLDPLASLLSHPGCITGALVLLYYEISFFRATRGGRAPSIWPAITYAALLLLFFFVRNLLLVAYGIDYFGELLIYWSHA